MADPLPVNSRRDRNPPVAQQSPFGGLNAARPNPFNPPPPVPARPLGNNPPAPPAFANRPAPAAPALPNRPAPPARQAAPAQGGLFERREQNPRRTAARRRERARELGERIMYVIAGLVLFAIVVLSRMAQNDMLGLRVEAYEPRGGAVSVEAAPTGVPAVTGEVAVVTGVMASGDLVRECPSTDCLALASPVMLMAGTPVAAIARDVSGLWVQIVDDTSAWRGWVPVGALALAGSIDDLPVA